MVYLDHRCFLPHTDMLRKDSNNFPNKRASVSRAPQFKTMEFVDKAIEKVYSAKTKSEKKSILQEVGCRGPYSFRKLPFYDKLPFYGGSRELWKQICTPLESSVQLK